jgi:hypothetical protein
MPFHGTVRGIRMATWITTAIPLIPEVIRLATPYFSKKPTDKGPDLVASVAELQDAARTNVDAITRNAEALETFAENTQKYIEALQIGVVALRKELAIARIVSIVAATAAALAFCLAAYALAA